MAFLRSNEWSLNLVATSRSNEPALGASARGSIILPTHGGFLHLNELSMHGATFAEQANDCGINGGQFEVMQQSITKALHDRAQQKTAPNKRAFFDPDGSFPACIAAVIII